MFDVPRYYIHDKTGNQYTALGIVLNATNENDGQEMMLYERDGKQFVRELAEFHDKFTQC